MSSIAGMKSQMIHINKRLIEILNMYSPIVPEKIISDIKHIIELIYDSNSLTEVCANFFIKKGHHVNLSTIPFCIPVKDMVDSLIGRISNDPDNTMLLYYNYKERRNILLNSKGEIEVIDNNKNIKFTRDDEMIYTHIRNSTGDSNFKLMLLLAAIIISPDFEDYTIRYIKNNKFSREELLVHQQEFEPIYSILSLDVTNNKFNVRGLTRLRYLNRMNSSLYSDTPSIELISLLKHEGRIEITCQNEYISRDTINDMLDNYCLFLSKEMLDMVIVSMQMNNIGFSRTSVCQENYSPFEGIEEMSDIDCLLSEMNDVSLN